MNVLCFQSNNDFLENGGSTNYDVGKCLSYYFLHISYVFSQVKILLNIDEKYLSYQKKQKKKYFTCGNKV